MAIRLISDLHHEFLDQPVSVFPLVVPNDVVTICVLAGDIGYPSDPKLKQFLINTTENFDHTIMVAGNHEYYSKEVKSMDEIKQSLHRLCLETGTIFLDQGEYHVQLHDKSYVRFIGCTLWSKIKSDCQCLVERVMNDFKYIHTNNDEELSVNVYNQLHLKDKNWLTRTIPSTIPTVVITHHLPSNDLVHPYYRKHPMTTAGCFSSCCEYTLAPNVVGWLCGHSHLGYHAKIGKFQTPCWLNPRGYPGEQQTNFDPDFALYYP